MFNLQDYEDVAARIIRFREKYDSGRIVIDVISHNAEKGHVLIEASVYRYVEDTLPASVDVAFGDASTFNANMRKFYVEDTATSAIGRAIGLLLGTDKRPTKQDMGRVDTVKPSQPQTASATVKQVSPIGDELVNDPWETYTSVLGNQTTEPRELDASILIQQELGGEIVESCKHGVRNLKEGTSKAGKPYKGFVCPSVNRNDQCQPIWWSLSPSGKFIPPKEAGDE